MTRALVFDLDDTLYPERRFALSGYAAVARCAEARYGVPSPEAFAVLRDALRTGNRPEAFQALASRAGAGPAAVSIFRDVYRAHKPSIRLSRAARAVLARAGAGWRVGLLTNGIPSVQRAKVAALGLEPLVDCVIYAHEVGAGKPDPAVFAVACDRLGVPPFRAVMAGDDPWCDVDGARTAGLHSIRLRRGPHRMVEAGKTGPADLTVHSLREVPEAADRLVAAPARARRESVSHVL